MPSMILKFLVARWDQCFSSPRIYLCSAFSSADGRPSVGTGCVWTCLSLFSSISSRNVSSCCPRSRQGPWIGKTSHLSFLCVSFTFTQNTLLPTLLVTKCVGFLFPTKRFCDTSCVPTIRLHSDPLLWEITSDPARQGLSSSRLLLLQAPPASTGSPSYPQPLSDLATGWRP